MRWELRYARDGWAHESGQYAAATGREPEWIAKCPPLARGEEFYIRAFWELSSCRLFGMVVGPIPWNHILLYAQFKQLDPEITDLFIRVIRELDEAYLSDQRTEQRKKTVK